MRLRRRPTGVLGVALGGLRVPTFTAVSASAYCRTTTCDPMSGDCRFDSEGCATEGHALHWPGLCTSNSISEDGSELSRIGYDAVQTLASKAVTRWVTAECPGGGSPTLTPLSTGPAECRDTGFDLSGRNVNLIVLRGDDWPYSNDGAILALTTIS